MNWIDLLSIAAGFAWCALCIAAGYYGQRDREIAECDLALAGVVF